ncbi:hypothetical protein, partial [Bacillus cereus]|uniref:hypothetical protein n=1 Tax=Bacillus cereus TaxID=1396 RepID=UPI00345BBDB1
TRFIRLSHSAAAAKDAKPKKVAAVDSPSFVMNLFRGKAVTDQVFPYPLNMTDDQKETLGMVLSPLEKMLVEVNDVVKNDENSDIPRAVLDQFAE